MPGLSLSLLFSWAGGSLLFKASGDSISRKEVIFLPPWWEGSPFIALARDILRTTQLQQMKNLFSADSLRDPISQGWGGLESLHKFCSDLQKRLPSFPKLSLKPDDYFPLSARVTTKQTLKSNLAISPVFSNQQLRLGFKISEEAEVCPFHRRNWCHS